MIELQDIITTKRELLSRETYSRNPINYSEDRKKDGMGIQFAYFPCGRMF